MAELEGLEVNLDTHLYLRIPWKLILAYVKNGNPAHSWIVTIHAKNTGLRNSQL